jgi:hypothetical protein
MNFPALSLGTIAFAIFFYWLGRRFQWWPSFLPG